MAVSVLAQRLMTASVLLVLFLGGLFALPLKAFVLLTAAIVLIAAWEWTYLMKLTRGYQRILFLLLIAILCLGVLQTKAHYIFRIALIWWLITIPWVLKYPALTDVWTKTSTFTLFGTQVLIPAWLGLCWLRQQPLGEWWVLFLLSLVAVADSAAYFYGKHYGKRPLAPRVSPGKTREGMYAACFASFIVTIIFVVVLEIPMEKWLGMLGLGLLTVLFSVWGDLVESMVKRHRGVKDSGSLLPGHGGILDRIDGLTAAAPIFCVGLGLLDIIKP